MIQKSGFTIILLFCYASIFAQDSLTNAVVSKYTYAFTNSSNRLSGAGWDSLRSAIRRAQFVLVGENHASPQLSLLFAVLLKEIKPLGYQHFIIETGPIASEKLKELYDKNLEKFSKNINGFLTAYKLDEDSPPSEFMKMTEDVNMYNSAFESGYNVYGIDKEYYSSYRYLLDRLEKYCRSGSLKSLYTSAKAKLAKYDSAELADRKFTRFNTIAHDAVINAFLLKVRKVGSDATKIVGEINNSLAIYTLYENRKYFDSEELRMKLIKGNFGAYYRAHQSAAVPFKAIIKYGNVHTGRGESFYGHLDIGNAISELANLNNTNSLHIMGMRRYRYDAEGNVADFFNQGYEVYPHLMAMVSKTEWRVVDLRALRCLINSKLLVAGKEETVLIRNNDYVLLTPIDGADGKSLNYH